MYRFAADARARPLPDLSELRRRKENYARVPIRATQDAALERAERFGLAGRNFYAHSENPPYRHVVPGSIDALWLRTALGERLQQADARLRPEGVCLFLLDAWRPTAVQRYFHDHWFPAELRRRHPGWSEDRVAQEVRRYWAAPSSIGAPAPHATGGAVDLTLITLDGGALYMGSLFDDVTALAHLDRFENLDPAAASFSDEEARGNRRLLYWAMSEAGLAAHPDEWWHYSFGDQMWAAQFGVETAFYDAAEPPHSAA